jgi:hypothetical protein
MDHEFLFSSQRGEPAPCCWFWLGDDIMCESLDDRTAIADYICDMTAELAVLAAWADHTDPNKSANGLRMLRRSLRSATWQAIWRATRRSCRALTPHRSNPQTSFGYPRYAPRKDSLASFRSICEILAAAFGEDFQKQEYRRDRLRQPLTRSPR